MKLSERHRHRRIYAVSAAVLMIVMILIPGCQKEDSKAKQMPAAVVNGSLRHYPVNGSAAHGGEHIQKVSEDQPDHETVYVCGPGKFRLQAGQYDIQS